MNWRMLLSHHHAHEEGERCVKVWGLPPICRRCLLLYPLTFVVMVVGLALPELGLPWLEWIMFGGPFLASLLFVLEQMGIIAYKRWQIWLGAPLLAMALGFGFARYLREPTDPLFWGMILLYGLPCVAAVWYRSINEEGEA